MKKIILTILTGLFLVSYAYADTVEAPIAPTRPKTISGLVAYYSEEYKVSDVTMLKVLSCESDFNKNIRGDGGHSRGLSQISEIWHPEVTDAESFDIDFAIKFLAEGISKGKGHEWTCYRNLAIDG